MDDWNGLLEAGDRLLQGVPLTQAIANLNRVTKVVFHAVALATVAETQR